jgi:hypothetical protein
LPQEMLDYQNRWRKARYTLTPEQQKAKRGQQQLAKFDVRLRIAQIKLERGCADCGYRGHPAALDFDHLPGFEKLKSVGSMTGCAWEDIEAEIAKCDVVCSNCHRVRTWRRSWKGGAGDVPSFLGLE